ncbi:MAG: Fe-S cluster assembly protein SufB [Ureaplasma sp.]|nr:Fe-S cluster assembly protein SufB [Ureaplasma sp.]
MTNNNEYKYGFHNDNDAIIQLDKGINEDIINKISDIKNESKELREIRLKAYEQFKKIKNPNWGPDLSFIDFDSYVYYSTSANNMANSWDDVPDNIKETFEKIGIMESEAKYLNGVATQYDSEMIYHSLLEELKEKNVIFTDPNTAAREHPEIFYKYFSKLVPMTDNKYAALNTAVWSGGTFIYIPKNTVLEKPLQSYFRINAKSVGQFERTLIIVDENSSVHYIEGCTAPIYDKNNLHAAVVEVFVEKNATCRYTTIQNWSDNVLNLVTKRAITKENARMIWIDGNIGSKINMKYPATILAGDNSSAKCVSIAVANEGIYQDAGAKMIHVGKNTTSQILSKAIGYKNSNSVYRGLVKIGKTAKNSTSFVECDTLLLDKTAKSDAIPVEIIDNNTSKISHEAKISKISDEQMFYLMSKGFNKQKAEQLIVSGFFEDFSKELPMEYAVELNQLLKQI